MDAASAVKANKPTDAFGAGGPLLGRGMPLAGAAPVGNGAPYPVARMAVHRFSPHRRRPVKSRADGLSAGWREFLLRTGPGEFTTPPMLAAPAAALRGRWSPRRCPDQPRDDAVGEVETPTSVTGVR
jgi:hypothetical protein